MSAYVSVDVDRDDQVTVRRVGGHDRVFLHVGAVMLAITAEQAEQLAAAVTDGSSAGGEDR